MVGVATKNHKPKTKNQKPPTAQSTPFPYYRLPTTNHGLTGIIIDTKEAFIIIAPMNLPKQITKALFFVVVLLVCMQAVGQVNISPGVYSFGQVNDWENPPATFTITNTGKEPLVFLPLFPQEDIMVEFPAEAVAPGKSVTVKVFYYTSQPGSFQRSVEFYVNVSDKPFSLMVEGDIMSLNANALVTCPGFAPKTFGEAQSFNQEIHVIDKLTKRPLEDVTVRIIGNNTEYKDATNSNGDVKQNIMLGLHDILLSKVGYMPELRIFYLNKNTGMLTVEMRKDTSYRLLAGGVKFKVDTLDENPRKKDTIATAPVSALIPNTFNPDLLPVNEYKANNIVFLIDASTSMKYANKLPLLKKSMKELTGVLRDIDRVSMITYNNTTNIVATGITGDNKTLINGKIDSITPFSWTNGVKGIETAYAIADKNYALAGNNQIILATDGLFNNPNFDEDALIELVKQQSKYGIKLSVVGFGDDEKAHKLMKKIAAYGKGSFIHIVPNVDSSEVLVNEIKNNSLKKP